MIFYLYVYLLKSLGSILESSVGVRRITELFYFWYEDHNTISIVNANKLFKKINFVSLVINQILDILFILMIRLLFYDVNKNKYIVLDFHQYHHLTWYSFNTTGW